MIPVLFAAHPDDWPKYEAPLRQAFADAGLKVALGPDIAPATARYLVYAPNSPFRDFSIFPQARAVLNLWAGVENLVRNETLTLPLCRMVETGLTEGMVEWVTGMVLRHHLGTDRYVLRQAGWDPVFPPLARDRTVAVLGLGELGAACAAALRDLNFDVLGWSRSAKALPGVATHAGGDGLTEVLRRSQIVVLLLPLTPATEGLIGAEALDLMPEGAVLINPGRGGLIDEAALLGALDRGRLAHATLDVFREEPLPDDHPFWSHPRVTVTPHVASATRPETAARTIAENVRRGETGEPFLYVVARARAY